MVNFIWGTKEKDVLHGTDESDVIQGFDRDDLLYGYLGNDRLFGGAGKDTLFGGAGADVLDGGEDNDTASYINSASGVKVKLSGTGSGGDAEGDTLINIESLVGSRHDDYLFGDTGDNVISGSRGNDRIYGGGGNDRIYGGIGNDELNGGEGVDIFYGGIGDDNFVFTDGDGHDTIEDFVAGAGSNDVIDLSDHSGVNGFNNIVAAQVGPDTFIDLGNDSITLLGVNAVDLHADDFILTDV